MFKSIIDFFKRRIEAAENEFSRCELLKMIPPRQRAELYYHLARQYGIVRQHVGLGNPDPNIAIGQTRIWSVDDPIFLECAVAHDAAYNELEPEQSTFDIDQQLRECMLHKVELFEAGLIDDEGEEIPQASAADNIQLCDKCGFPCRDNDPHVHLCDQCYNAQFDKTSAPAAAEKDESK